MSLPLLAWGRSAPELSGPPVGECGAAVYGMVRVLGSERQPSNTRQPNTQAEAVTSTQLEDPRGCANLGVSLQVAVGGLEVGGLVCPP